MTLEELQQQVDRDFKLDDTELDAESVKIPLLHNKYLQHFNKFSLLLKKAEYDYKTLQDTNGNTILVNQTHRFMQRNLLI